MGRKIPARKHFGVRDPIKQSQQRFALIKDKINNPPEKRDFQKVSHSLARFIKLKESTKETTSKPLQKKLQKRSTNQNEDKPENYTKKNTPKTKSKSVEARNDKEFKNLRQQPNESDKSFMRRVNRVTQESVEEAKFEAKYGVEVVRDKKSGEIRLKKRPPNEIDERLKQNAANSKRKGKKPPAIVIPSEERKKLAKAMLEEMKRNESEAKSPTVQGFKRDEFRFGEVVNAPPQLTVPRLAKKAETVPRPGRKSLILHSVIDEYSKKDESSTSKPKSADNVQKTIIHKKKDLSLKGKRKDLSMSMRQMIETEQDNAVKLYKELKKKQRIQNKTE